MGSIVHYDANLSDEARESDVRTPDGKVPREVGRQNISLGHELIHSDHSHCGGAAYDRRTMPIRSTRQYTFDASRGEQTNREQINILGLDVSPEGHGADKRA